MLRVTRLAAARRLSSRAASSAATPWSTVDPDALSGANPGTLLNLCGGQWQPAAESTSVVDPMTGEAFLSVPATSVAELEPFIASAAQCPKTGLHNPLNNVERYLMLGEVSFKMAELFRDPEVERYLARLIQRVTPKSYAQAAGEVRVTRDFFENFTGDNVRFLAKGFTTPGDHFGQQSTGHRWPYGPVALVYPFNFPIEIPTLQLMGALYMGNKVTLKACSRTGLVMEQILRMLHHCGLPTTDVDYVHCGGRVMNEFLMQSQPRITQFTGSSHVAEQLARDLHGKVRIEDAGYDWKVLGPDVADFDYVAWQSDQDSSAAIGQKCSAQSALFMHENWEKAGLLDRLTELANRRSLDDLTTGPLLSVTNKEVEAHQAKLLAIPGSYVVYGGERLPGPHSIPDCYGSYKPTAVFVPIEEFAKPEHFAVCAEEIFGSFQVITSYNDAQLDTVLDIMERMAHHLTAAVVSNDLGFLNHVLANTVNGTTYAGIRARTTGAPQNHHFGPSSDPRGASIGTREAVINTWSCHREIIMDMGPVPAGWEVPEAS